MSPYLLGFDIGGTKCATVLGRRDAAGVEILDRRVFATADTRDPQATFVRLESQAHELVAAHQLSLSMVQGVGISCGGPLDSASGRILGPPNLPGWDNVPIVRWCQANLQMPSRLQNDANACALAEWRWGAGRGCQHLVFLTFGTGMGAGLVLNGRLYAGACDLAGEVGHIRLSEDGPTGYGKAGSFEGWCSGGGIAQAARRIGMNLAADGVFDAAAKGDSQARRIIEDAARTLGRGLALLVDLLNPQVIVIGSIFARRQAQLWPIAQAILQQEALPGAVASCRIVPAVLGESLGDYAALAVALGEQE